MWAAEGAHEEIVKILLDAGANVNLAHKVGKCKEHNKSALLL